MDTLCRRQRPHWTVTTNRDVTHRAPPLFTDGPAAIGIVCAVGVFAQTRKVGPEKQVQLLRRRPGSPTMRLALRFFGAVPCRASASSSG